MIATGRVILVGLPSFLLASFGDLGGALNCSARGLAAIDCVPPLLCWTPGRYEFGLTDGFDRVGRGDDVLSNDISNDMSSGAVGMTVNTSSSSMTSDDIMSE